MNAMNKTVIDVTGFSVFERYRQRYRALPRYRRYRLLSVKIQFGSDAERILESCHRSALTARAIRYGAYVFSCVAVTGALWVSGALMLAPPAMSLGRVR